MPLYLQRNFRPPPVFLTDKHLPFNTVDPTAKTVNDQLLIYKYLQMLPRESRAVLILAYYEDLPGKEIAQILNLPLGTVKSKLYYSLRKLKRWIAEEENSYVQKSVN